MAKKTSIESELKVLESSLASQSIEDVYVVPVGYFESFPEIMLNRVRNLTAGKTSDEATDLSPLLDGLSRVTPYILPAGYFDGLEEKIMERVRAYEDYQTSREETRSLSPLLDSLRNNNPYEIPAGYFDTVTVPVQKTEKEQAGKVIAFPRRWVRYAVAAAVVTLIAISGIRIFPGGNESGSVAKSIEKKIDKDIKNNAITSDEVEDFLELTDALATTDSRSAINPGAEAVSKDYLKDVSDDEIINFLDQLPDGNDDTGILN